MTDLPGRRLDLPLPPALAETFGYRGEARFVGFSWSPCGDELVVDDGLSSETGQSWAFLTYRRHPAVATLLRGWNLGASDTEAEFALVLDRTANRVSLAPLHDARAFLERQHPPATPLTEEQREELEQRVEEMMARGWRDEPVDMEQVRRSMEEQRGRVGRMVAWLDMCPAPPQQGRGT
jgi:hypothetical protein